MYEHIINKMYEGYCTKQLNHKYTQPMFQEHIQVKESSSNALEQLTVKGTWKGIRMGNKWQINVTVD